LWAVEEPGHPKQGRLALAVRALLKRPRDQVQQRLVVHVDAARRASVVKLPPVAEVEDGEPPHPAVGSRMRQDVALELVDPQRRGEQCHRRYRHAGLDQALQQCGVEDRTGAVADQVHQDLLVRVLPHVFVPAGAR
jgi:hypothetical protein